MNNNKLAQVTQAGRSLPGPVWRMLSAIVVAALVAGCSGGGFNLGVGDWFGGKSSSSKSEETGPRITQQDIESINTGGAKVALLLPLSAQGQTAQIAKGLKEAGELALFEAPQRGIVLVTKDTTGTPAGAQAAANAAVTEQAEIIIGPLLSTSVKAINPIVRSSQVPVIAFSSDRNAAGNGTFLLSFLPGQEVDRVVEHAIGAGRKNFAALIPKSPYGAVVERALIQSLRKRGGKIVSVERYARTPEGIAAPVQKIAEASNDPSLGVQAVLLPEGGQMLRAIGSALADAGFNTTNAKLLGTGLWDDPTVNSVPILTGGWYAGPAPNAKQQFAQRFRNAYGREPPRLASLAYDAVSLANAIASSPKGERFTTSQLANPGGFGGVDGIFRFRKDGLNDRGLAVMEVAPEGPRIVGSPPNRFSNADS